jgi:tight adherence protein C
MHEPLFSHVSTFGRLAPFLGVAAILIGGVALIFSSVSLGSRTLARRIEMVQSRPPAGGPVPDPTPAPGEEHRFEDGTQGLSMPEQRQIARFFSAYNVSPDAAILCFTLFRLCTIAILACLAYLAAAKTTWPLPLLVATVAATAGWFIPIIAVRIALGRHRKAVATGLPDAIELLAICADAGVSLESGLERVSRELRTTQPALAGELSLTWAQISILPNRDQALLNLAERIDLPGLRSVVGTLSQSMRFGTPLAQSLRTAAIEMRNERLLRLEERANRLPGLLTFPVMLLIMPTLFLIIGGPAVIKILDTFKYG